MIKIVCINKNLPPSWNSNNYLNIGEIYEAKPEYIGLQLGYRINKANKLTRVKFWYPETCFITLSEWREQQMKSVIDD
jgi:hypothetical protein